MAGSIYDWSTTAGDNATADGDINWAEGQLPSTVNGSARQMMGRVAEWVKDQGALTATGTNTISISANSGFTAYATGRRLSFKAAGTNTDVVTLNANSIGGKKVQVVDSVGERGLVAGEIVSGNIYTVRYDAAADTAAGAWILENPNRVRFPSVDINGGTIDNVTIGGATAGNGTFAVLTANSYLSVPQTGSSTSPSIRFGSEQTGLYQGGSFSNTFTATCAGTAIAHFTASRVAIGKITSSIGTAGLEFFSTGIAWFTGDNIAIAAFNRLNGNGQSVVFQRDGSNVGSISVTTTATAYNTSSDYRLKDNVEDLQNSGAFIDALRPREFTWRSTGARAAGFIAHEFAEVSPSSVTGEKDGPEMQAMQPSSPEVMAHLIAELQSLRTRVAALELAVS